MAHSNQIQRRAPLRRSEFICPCGVGFGEHYGWIMDQERYGELNRVLGRALANCKRPQRSAIWGRRWCQFTSAPSITFTTTATMLRFFAANMRGKTWKLGKSSWEILS